MDEIERIIQAWKDGLLTRKEALALLATEALMEYEKTPKDEV